VYGGLCEKEPKEVVLAYAAFTGHSRKISDLKNLSITIGLEK